MRLVVSGALWGWASVAGDVECGVSPLPEPCCSADACTEAAGSEDEEGSGLLIDELPDEILEHVLYQHRQGMFDSSHKS